MIEAGVFVVTFSWDSSHEQIATRDVETASRLPDPRELSTACELCARLMQSPDAARIRALAGER